MTIVLSTEQSSVSGQETEESNGDRRKFGQIHTNRSGTRLDIEAIESLGINGVRNLTGRRWHRRIPSLQVDAWATYSFFLGLSPQPVRRSLGGGGTPY